VIPLSHQLRALRRAVSQDRVRFLLADEVGLGKPIEAGLIMRELKLRGLVRRTLVIAPNCVFRRHSDTDSDFIRTGFRRMSDSVPEVSGQQSGAIRTAIRDGPDSVPV
jgi:SNF2 family DNA or RNA helicase